MFATELMLPFLGTAPLLAVTPGPGMFYIAAQTMGRGRKAGRFSAVGTHLASYICIFAAAFGLSLACFSRRSQPPTSP